MTTYERFVDNLVTCYDCHQHPDDQQFTVVYDPEWFAVRVQSPNVSRLYADYICNACFFRRRLEGRL